MNYTFYQATSDCIGWCREQIDTHQSNIQTENMFVLVVAMGFLFVQTIMGDYGDWFVRNTDLDEGHVRIIYSASGYFAFILMALFLIYYTVFQ